MITEDYIGFETAKLLKEKGFDAECKKYYNLKMLTNLYYGCEYVRNRDLKDEDDCVAPTLQMAFKWLREVHNIFINITFRFSRNADNDINFSYYAEKYENHYGYGDGEFNSYEEACEEAIRYSLENLI